MKKHFFFSLLMILILNIFLYLIDDLIRSSIFILINILSLFFYFIIFKMITLEKKLNKISLKLSDDNFNIESADDHPIIKSARKRLGK